MPKLSPSSSNKEKAVTTSSHPAPPSSCGPNLLPDNEFIQFYAELYKSAILFSNPSFQQSLLFPQGQGSSPQGSNGDLQQQGKIKNKNNGNVRFRRESETSNNNNSKGSLRNVKKAQRRLSNNSVLNNLTNPTEGLPDPLGTSSTEDLDVDIDPNTSVINNEEEGQDQGAGSIVQWNSEFKTFYHQIMPPPQPISTSTPKPNKGLRRKVSFSKGFSPPLRLHDKGKGINNLVLLDECEREGPCWSSDLDETDTTEEDEDEGTSTTQIVTDCGGNNAGDDDYKENQRKVPDEGMMKKEVEIKPEVEAGDKDKEEEIEKKLQQLSTKEEPEEGPKDKNKD